MILPDIGILTLTPLYVAIKLVAEVFENVKPVAVVITALSEKLFRNDETIVVLRFPLNVTIELTQNVFVTKL